MLDVRKATNIDQNHWLNCKKNKADASLNGASTNLIASDKVWSLFFSLAAGFRFGFRFAAADFPSTAWSASSLLDVEVDAFDWSAADPSAAFFRNCVALILSPFPLFAFLIAGTTNAKQGISELTKLSHPFPKICQGKDGELAASLVEVKGTAFPAPSMPTVPKKKSSKPSRKVHGTWRKALDSVGPESLGSDSILAFFAGGLSPFSPGLSDWVQELANPSTKIGVSDVSAVLFEINSCLDKTLPSPSVTGMPNQACFESTGFSMILTRGHWLFSIRLARNENHANVRWSSHNFLLLPLWRPWTMTMNWKHQGSTNWDYIFRCGIECVCLQCGQACKVELQQLKIESKM